MAPRLLSKLAVALVAIFAFCCNEGGDITGGPEFGKREKSENSAGKKKKKKNGELEFDGEVEGSALETDDVTTSGKKDSGKKDDPPASDPGPESPAPPPAPPAPIDYPVLEYAAKGVTTCDGENYNTTANIVTSLDDNKLNINMVAAKVFCGGRCQKEADKEIANSIGQTTYTRTQRAKIDQLQTANKIPKVEFVILADSVVKPKGQAFAFDSPLPAFPFPAPKARYAALNNGPVGWQANVTGHRNMTVQVTVEKIAEAGDIITLRFQTIIVQDPGTRVLYEEFPLPRMAIYEVNTAARDVRSINATNWFNGEKCDNKPEQVNLLYKMCKKTKKGVPEAFPCQ